MWMGRIGVRFLEERRRDLLYANDLFLCGESEKDLKVMGFFVDVY